MKLNIYVKSILLIYTCLFTVPCMSLETGKKNFYKAVNYKEKSIRHHVSKASQGITRDYNLVVAGTDRNNLTYIVTTLGNEPIYKIIAQKSALQKAGDAIKHIHPLRFLECVFTSEELKAAIHKIPKRSWIGSEFMDGIIGSLREEYAKGNLPDAFIKDFANNIHIDVSIINPFIKERKWDKFIHKLIEIVPRSGDSGRYNM